MMSRLASYEKELNKKNALLDKGIKAYKEEAAKLAIAVVKLEKTQGLLSTEQKNLEKLRSELMHKEAKIELVVKGLSENYKQTQQWVVQLTGDLEREKESRAITVQSIEECMKALVELNQISNAR